MMSILPQASIAVWTSASGASRLGQVAAEDGRLARDLGRRLLGQVGVEVVDDHLGAVLAEQLGRRAADAARRAGHDRHLVVEDSHGEQHSRCAEARLSARPQSANSKRNALWPLTQRHWPLSSPPLTRAHVNPPGVWNFLEMFAAVAPHLRRRRLAAHVARRADRRGVRRLEVAVVQRRAGGRGNEQQGGSECGDRERHHGDASAVGLQPVRTADHVEHDLVRPGADPVQAQVAPRALDPYSRM